MSKAEERVDLAEQKYGKARIRAKIERELKELGVPKGREDCIFYIYKDVFNIAWVDEAAKEIKRALVGRGLNKSGEVQS